MSLRTFGSAVFNTTSRSTTPRVWSGPSTPPSGISLAVSGPGDRSMNRLATPDRPTVLICALVPRWSGFGVITVDGHLHLGQAVVGQLDRGDLPHLAPADLDQVALDQLAAVTELRVDHVVAAAEPEHERRRDRRDGGQRAAREQP